MEGVSSSVFRKGRAMPSVKMAIDRHLASLPILNRRSRH